MATRTHSETSKIDVHVSPDNLEAVLIMRSGATMVPPTSEEVMELLRERRIPLNRDATARIKEALVECRKGRLPRGGVLLARGTPPTESADEALTWLVEPEEISARTPLPLRRVKAGQPVARIESPERGQDGVDVFGQPIPAEEPTPLKLILGANVTRDDNGKIIASSDGAALLCGDRLRVVPMTETSADDLAEGQSVEFDGLLVVRGNPPAGVTISASAGIFIAGRLGAGSLRTAGSVVCTAGIEGLKKQTFVETLADAMATHVFNASLDVGRDLWITNEMQNSEANVLGALRASEAVIASSKVVTARGAEVGVLGAPGMAGTDITVGVHQKLIAEHSQLNRLLSRTAEALSRLNVAGASRSPDAGVDQETERLCRIDAARQQLTKVRSSVQGRLLDLRRDMLEYFDATVVVQEAICPGCDVAVGSVRGRIDSEWVGQVTICSKQLNGTNSLVVESASGRRMVVRTVDDGARHGAASAAR